MSNYVKQVTKYAFVSNEFKRGKAYHIVNNKSNCDMSNHREPLYHLPKEFDALFNYIDVNGNAIFLTICNEVEWVDIKAEDVVNGDVDIIDLSSVDISSNITDDNKSNDNNIIIDDSINKANEILESHKRLVFEYGVTDVGSIHQPSIEEKESFFIQPNIDGIPV